MVAGIGGDVRAELSRLLSRIDQLVFNNAYVEGNPIIRKDVEVVFILVLDHCIVEQM